MSVSLRGVRKVFPAAGGPVAAVDGVDLDDRRGRVLRHARTVRLGQDHRAADDRRLRAAHRRAGPARRRGRDRPAPFERDVNTVFQDYALFPHMTVRRERRVRPAGPQGAARPSGARRIEQALATVRLTGFGDRRPSQLSGGQRQRVALARALVNRPEGAAARRAARRARPQAARADAGRAEGDPARGRHHLRLRHPRPGARR